MPTSHAQRTVWDALVGVAAALLVFGAVPGVLVGLVGLPLPRHWDGHDVISWRGLFDLLAVVSWCAWAVCARPILLSAVARVRSGDLTTASRLSDRVALRIALGALALSSLLGLGVATADASVAGASAPYAASAAAPEPGAASVVQRFARGFAEPHGTCTVGEGDTLASLAASHYGDPSAWRAIASANLGRLMDDGTRFVDPSTIVRGWTLVVPKLDAETDAVTTATARTEPRPRTPAAVEAPHPLSTLDALLPIAELSAAGVSALVAGLLARRSRQLRRLQAFLREEGQESSRPAEREADLEALVAPFEKVPLLDVVEAAARRLRGALATLDPRPGAVQWLRAGHDGVEVRFPDAHHPESLPGWRRSSRSTWTLTAAVEVAELSPAARSDEPWCAVLLPLGDDERGTWLLPVEAGACVAVLGPRAPDLVLAMRAAMSSWSWHEAVAVTDDVAEATRLASPGAGRAAGPHVLFVGDPASLPGAARDACAVLATSQDDHATVTVLVDDRGASAHPLGLTVRPPLLDRSWTAAVDALLDPKAADEGRSSRALVQRRTPPATLRLPAMVDAEVPAPLDLFSWSASPTTAREPHRQPPLSPRGRAEVRLLGSLPGIVGLQDDLPPKRARRAVELVAYLAMHAPDPVTGDRLRTRVLGSADADAAAKTLFNTVGAARRALGAGADGEPLLPPATRSGHYRLSPFVTVDVTRAAALLREGLTTRDAEASTHRLREGLELVKGEPLGGVLTGYTWWRAEGHERRIADAVVDGACALVRAALASGDLDLARWALAQARKVEPYCESLTRAAMRVAAASGDARRLHVEWQECKRQMDELDPGGAPSERTEQLYALLRAGLAGDGVEQEALRA